MKKSLKILLAIIILLLICVLVFNSKKQDKDEKQEYGEKNVFNSNNEIKTALTLNDKIQNDTIWCGTFQLLWNDLKNNLAKQLESLINNGKTYVIDMTGTCYMRDDVTGEIVEYPFEKMDPSEICEPFISGSNTLLAITSNKDNTIAASEIIQTILQY